MIMIKTRSIVRLLAARVDKPLSIFVFSGFVVLLMFIWAVGPSVAQAPSGPSVTDDLRGLVDTPSVPGYEGQLTERISAKLSAFHPVTDNIGDLVVTIGSGSPNRLIVAPIDETGFVVSEVTEDGYLRLQRLPQSGLPPIYNELYSAQPVKVQTSTGKWIDGVVAGLSIHLENGRENPPKSSDIDNMYIDIGASSAAEVRKAGVDILSPVVVNRDFGGLSDGRFVGASVGDKFGAAALVELLDSIDPKSIKGTLTVAFAVQQRTGGRGLERILRTGHFDEMIYVGRLIPGGAVPGVQNVHRAPRREPGEGVLIGFAQTNDTLSGFAQDLKRLAEANKITLANDYSASMIPASRYLLLPDVPMRSAHLGIATAWPDTPAEMISGDDLEQLTSLLAAYVGTARSLSRIMPAVPRNESRPEITISRPPTNTQTLESLVSTYGASNHEALVRDDVKLLLPEWTKPETDQAGNLILRVGTASGASKTPKILVVAHMDEIGFEVKSIANDGRLNVETLGGMELSFYEGHPMLVHTASGDRNAIMELPRGWDEASFQWPTEAESALRIDVGARNPKEVADLGIKIGDWVTIPKKYRPLLGTRANGRSFDDRVGDTALVSAVWALGGPLKERDVTFVWSTGEELGLDGAAALAKRLAAEGNEPDYVFAVDTLVSSDSPLESKRFADVAIGKGFAIRAVDNSNIAARELVDRLAHLARTNQIPVQIGVTGGGNDGSAFVPYGATDIAIGWPLRYSHSPAEVIDVRDVDALARIVTVIAKSW
jgi:putative aminopeptidase